MIFFSFLFFKYLLETVRTVAMGMANVQEPDAGKEYFNSHIFLQHNIVFFNRKLTCM